MKHDHWAHELHIFKKYIIFITIKQFVRNGFRYSTQIPNIKAYIKAGQEFANEKNLNLSLRSKLKVRITIYGTWHTLLCDLPTCQISKTHIERQKSYSPDTSLSLKNMSLTLRFKVNDHYPWYATHCVRGSTHMPNIKSLHRKKLSAWTQVCYGRTERSL